MKKTSNMYRAAQALLLASCASLSLVQAQGISDEELAAAHRSSFDNSPELPDGLAFVATLRMLRAMESEEPELTVGLIETEMGLDSNSANKLADSLLAALEKFDSDESATVRETVCEYGVPKAVGDSAFELLDSMDDARAKLAERHLSAFRQTLKGDTQSRFQQWLEYRKLNIVHVTYDHKKMAELHGRDNMDGEVAGLCNMLEREHVARGSSK